MPDRPTTPALLGLIIALLGPAVVGLASSRLVGKVTPLAANLAGQIGLLLVLAAVLAIVVVWEHQPLASIGIKSPKLSSLVWGLLLAAFFVFVYSPALFWVLKRLGQGGFEAGLSRLALLPAWYRLVAVLIGGAVEEVLYRGFAIERLKLLTGRYWIAAFVASLAFGVAHAPLWGWAPALLTAVSGLLLSGFYIWRRDLWANIIAHAATDFVGIVVMLR